nr:MAG TPA: hypothetical protein [Caudoviricetes sp.]
MRRKKHTLPAKIQYLDLRGVWVQELIDNGLIDPLPHRMSVYQVIITNGYGPHTHEWTQKYSPEKLMTLITENVEI